MYDSKSDGYTLVFHENDGIEIFELVAVGARIFASTSDGIYEVTSKGARKSTLERAMGSDEATVPYPILSPLFNAEAPANG